MLQIDNQCSMFFLLDNFLFLRLYTQTCFSRHACFYQAYSFVEDEKRIRRRKNTSALHDTRIISFLDHETKKYSPVTDSRNKATTTNSRQRIMINKQLVCPVFLFFSVVI